MDSGDIEITRTDGRLGIAGWLPGRTMAVITWAVNGATGPSTGITSDEAAAILTLKRVSERKEYTLIKARLRHR